MSVSGRSAIPTERPSSIQKPMPSSRVRSSSESGDEERRARAGTANRGVATARARSSHAGREA